eukprot:4545334-Pleurochrysis_carterae.AAC.1
MPAPVPGSNAQKPFANTVMQKARGRGSARRKAPGLLQAFLFCHLTAAAGEKKLLLLLRWDGVDFNGYAA